MASSKSIYSKFLNAQVLVLRKNMRFQLGYFVVLLSFGIIVSFLLYLFNENLDDVLKIGPSIVMAGISSFPLKTVMINRERISAFNSLRMIIDDTTGLSPKEIHATEQIVMEIMKEQIKR